MEEQNLIKNDKFYKSKKTIDYFLKKEKLENELFLLEIELKKASIIKKFSLKLKIIDKKMQIDLLEMIIKKKKEEEEKINIIKKEFILVEGGSYFPSFTNEEKEVFDIEVFKYPITQKIWKKYMDIFPLDIIKIAIPNSKEREKYLGDNKPVMTFWWDALEFCNRLSKFCNLEPVYDLSKKELGILKIIELGGKIVNPDEANFENTEGFRLPLEIEWEWFARGGKKTLDDGSFDRYFSNNFYFGSDRDYDMSNEDYKREFGKLKDVGLIRPNQLGIYDCCKNWSEWCYDSVTVCRDLVGSVEREEYKKSKIKNGKRYIYNNEEYSRRLRGGDNFDDRYHSWMYKYNMKEQIYEKFYFALLGIFRVVRTVKHTEKISNTKKYIEKIYPKENFENMVLVEGGRYKPSFSDEEKNVFDIEVCKYITTQKMWLEVKEYNSARYKGENRPIECVGFWRILSYCNKLSIKYGLKPVYDLSKSDEEILMIKQLNGKTVPFYIADFKDTEGFRLPTEIEWEWFARGGQKAISERTFDYKYSGSNNIDEVAWYIENTVGIKNEKIYLKGGSTQNVGLKKPNQLGLYDCCGNVEELVHPVIKEGEKNIIVLEKGGAWCYEAEGCTLFGSRKDNVCMRDDQGFRLVRTI